MTAGYMEDIYGNAVGDEDLLASTQEALVNDWLSLEAERNGEPEPLSREPATETHCCPEQHYSIWTETGLYYIRRPWEDPPVTSVYKVWACFHAGCNVTKLEFIGDIPM